VAAAVPSGRITGQEPPPAVLGDAAHPVDADRATIGRLELALALGRQASQQVYGSGPNDWQWRWWGWYPLYVWNDLPRSW
jgi:hypothetical protein